MKRNFTFLFVLGLITLVSTQIKAGVINVSNVGNDGLGDGTPGNPYATIQYALGIVSTGDTILVEAGYYTGPININDNIVLLSKSGPHDCLIYGDGIDAVVIDSCSAVVNGFMIQNGYNLMVLNSASPEVSNCIFDGENINKGITINGDGGLIHHNIFINIMDWAFYITAGNTEISNNTMFNGMTAIWLEISVSNNITNNIIYGHSTGIQMDEASFGGNITYNDFYLNTTDISDSSYSVDASNMYVDPLFINADSMDLGLQPGSPLIDMGNPGIMDKDQTVSDVGAIPFFQGDMVNFTFYMGGNCSPAYIELYNNSQFNNYQGDVYYEWFINAQSADTVYDLYTNLYDIGDNEVKLVAYDSTGGQLGEFFQMFNVVDCSGGSDYVYFSYNMANNCAPATVSFNNESYFENYLGPVEYMWIVSADSVPPDTTFAETLPGTELGIGNYNIELFAFDTNQSIVGQYYDYLNIMDCSTIDYVDFYTETSSNCTPSTISFVNTSFYNNYNGPVNYEWYLNGNLISTADTPTDTTVEESYPYVDLYAYDSTGNYLGVASKNPDIYDCSGGENISFYYSQEGNCSGDIVSFINTSSMYYYTGEVEYVWFIRDKEYRGYEIPDTALPGGFHYINLEAYDTTGNHLGSYYSEIYVNGSTGNFQTSPGNVACPGEPINMWYNESYMSLYWDLGDGTTIFDNSYVNHSYNTEGEYPVTMIIQTYDCGSDTIIQTISVNSTATPVVNAFIERGNQYCPNDEVIFNIQGQFPEVSWEFEDGTVLNNSRVSYSFSDLGTHIAIAKVTNSCGNTGIDTVMVEIRNDIPVYGGFDWWYDGYNPCPLTPFKFDPYNPGNHSWDFGDGATSTVSTPYHAFASEGTYNVQLISYNGCGYTDTSYNQVEVFYSKSEFYTDFDIRTIDDDYVDYYDTILTLCPGEPIKLVPYENEEDGIQYKWFFGDGTSSIKRTPVHAWTTGGLKTITLKMRNNCLDSAIAQRQILIDPSRMPMSKLMHIPATVCPGDEVLFFDNESEPERNNYTYTIDFGDGSPALSGIKAPEDPKINSLASHIYSGSGPYEYIFTVTNECNNTDTVMNSIILTSDATNIPFYYVTNTTDPEMEKDREIMDWSVKKPNTHEFIIPVQWDAWDNGMSNDFKVYFWYGDFDPEGNDDSPAGTVSFTSDMINSGDSVVAHIPVEITEFHSVGIAATWYCDSARADGDPEVFGMPVDGMMNPINSFPISAGSVTDLRPIIGNIVLDLSGEWDGMCGGDIPEGAFKSPKGDGTAYYLDLWTNDKSTGEGGYNMFMGPEYFDENNQSSTQHISDGNTYTSGDSIMIVPYNGEGLCAMSGLYSFDYFGDSLIMYVLSDTCADRVATLAGRTYYRYENDGGGDYDKYMEGCPGDPVEFTVVGGSSYDWYFGDGNNLSTTDRYVTYSYADTGFYDAYVIITNSCNRIDTVYSPVRIGNQNVPMAYFNMSPWDPSVGDTVTFSYEGHDPTGSNAFTWRFGDGTLPKTGAKVKHVYKNGGDFFVRLTVKNGCGENTEGYNIWVKGGLNNCDIEARFISEVMTDTVQFENNSFGNITNGFWDFGDGSTSNELSPMHIYTEAGNYTACLTVIDSTTQCQSSICQDVWIGNVECIADFVFSTVSSTNTVILNDKSVGADYWSWDFGDGTTSNVQNPKHAYNQPGLYTIYLKTTNSTQSCFAEKGIEIQVGEIDSTFCFPEFGFFIDGMNVTFTDQSIGNITHWYWDLGDGTTANKQSVNHIYGKAGSYSVSLSILDTVSDCKNQVTKVIKIGEIDCQARFTYYTDSALQVKFTDKSLGNVSEWLWDFGDGNLSILQNPAYKYASPGVYEVTLSTYDEATDCFSKVVERITVGQVQDCFADFEFFVDGLKVSLADKALGNVNKRYWNFGNGTFGYKQNPQVTYKKSGIKKVCYLVSDTITGCQSEICKEIKVGNTDCGAEFTYFIDQKTKQVDFFDNSFGNYKNRLWNFGNGSISFDTNATIIYNNYDVYEVCLTISEDATGGCVSKACKEVIVKDTSSTSISCNARFTHVATEGSKEVIFKDATYTKVTSWFWDLGDGNFKKDSAFKHTYNEDGAYEVCLSTYNAETGCFSEKCKEVIVKTTNDTIESLDADFTYIPDSSSSSVKFVDESTGDPTNWYWTFGDGSYLKGEQEVSHNYGKPGTYMTCLYIFDAVTGNTSEECKIVPVGEKECALSAEFGKFIDPDTRQVIFSDKSTGNGSKWFWSFGDGTTSTRQNPTHTYAKPGLFLVSLSVRDESGGCSDYTADFIQVGSIDCKANFSYVVDADSNKVTLKSTSKGTVEKAYWSFDDGTHARGTSATHYYKGTGQYKVALTISTTGGTCTDYFVEPIQVGEIDCSAGFSVYVDSASNKAFFKSEVLGKSTRLLWTFGDGGLSTIDNPTHSYKAPGYFTVGLNTYDPNSNCMDYTEELVLIGQRGSDCEADFFYHIEDRKVDFYDNSVGDDLSHYWWFGDGATQSRSADTAVSYADGGYYYVCLTVATPSGIQNTRCKYIAVDPPAREDCLADFIYTVDSTNKTVKFIDKSLGEPAPDRWLWKFGDESSSTEQNPSHTYSTSGFFTVRLVSGNSSTECRSRSWQMINVGQGGGLRAGFGYELDSLDFKTGGYPVDFVGVSSGKPAKYSWDFGDGNTNSTNISPTHSYTEPGDYNVCLTVEDQVTDENDVVCEQVSIEDTTTTNPISIETIAQQFTELSAYPNPLTTYTNIEFSLPVSNRINLRIIDQSGREVQTLVNTVKEAGKHTLTWDASYFANGIYYVQLSTSQGVVKTKMIVKR